MVYITPWLVPSASRQKASFAHVRGRKDGESRRTREKHLTVDQVGFWALTIHFLSLACAFMGWRTGRTTQQVHCWVKGWLAHAGPSLLAESPIRGRALHVKLIRMPEPDGYGSKVFSALTECDEQRVKSSAATLHIHLVVC